MEGTHATSRRGAARTPQVGAVNSERDLLLEIRGRQIAQDDRLARIERRLGLLGDRKELERLKALEHVEKAQAAALGVRRIERALRKAAPTRSQRRGRTDAEPEGCS